MCRYFIFCSEMQYEYFLASGLALLTIGIYFLCSRISLIKKRNIAIATVVKLELRTDEHEPYYVPSFQFTSYNYDEIIYEHADFNSMDTWTLRQKIKVAYREAPFNNHDVLLLTFYNVFGLCMIFLTAGIVLLIVAGSFYWHVSGYTPCCLILGSLVIVPAVLKIWANRFFKSLE